MYSNQKDLNSEVKQVNAAMGRLTAGGTGDNTKITGATIDRGLQSMAQSASLNVCGHAVLGASATLSVALEIQDSADGSSWNTAVPIYGSTAILTDSGSGSTLTGNKQTGLDLSGYQRYVRFNPTPDLSAANTDTAEVAVSVTLAPGHVTPP